MNFLITLLGWAIWNWVAFSVEKDTYDDAGKDFPFQTYKSRNWDGWVGSLLVVPALLYIGYKQMDLNPFGTLIGVETSLSWNDLWFFGAGVVWEAIIFAYKKIKNYFKDKAAKLKD